MESSPHPLSEEEFRAIYQKVPRLTVEIIVRRNGAVLLTMRNIEPCKGMWHLPGGTVRFGEKLTDAVRRIAKSELGIDVAGTLLVGYIEYPSHYENGLDCPIGIAFEVINYSGSIELDDQAAEFGWFGDLPAELHQEQSDFLQSVFADP